MDDKSEETSAQSTVHDLWTRDKTYSHKQDANHNWPVPPLYIHHAFVGQTNSAATALPSRNDSCFLPAVAPMDHKTCIRLARVGPDAATADSAWRPQHDDRDARDVGSESGHGH